MVNKKKLVLQKINESRFIKQRGSFPFRVCKLITNGDFNKVIHSAGLADLLNEGPGKKVKTNRLASAMEPLLDEEIIKVKIFGRGRNRRKYWFPAWIDKQEVEDEILLPGFSENKTLFITGANAWTDSNENFPKIISALNGDLCVVDQFYGNGTFSTLAKFGKERKVKFLSAKLGDEEQRNIADFNINLKKFKSQFKNIKLKKYRKFWELHDRYIIADNALVVVGYGIKDFGGKESFVIFLPKKEVADFLPILKRIFEKRWRQSNDII
ncbi:MAG: hypothetical protein Q8N88_04600 [Nanoarchaeota archaeon]|nr:hypothetical protein [Nanoarchaeota archaeon]